MNTVRYTISIILGFALPYLVQRWDRARLPPEGAAAAWNGATWGSALYAFGPFSMLGWAWVTRVRFQAWAHDQGVPVAVLNCAGLLVAGAAAAAVILAMIVGVDLGLAWLVGAPD
jgi:hypothetical protein